MFFNLQFWKEDVTPCLRKLVGNTVRNCSDVILLSNFVITATGSTLEI
jgi:hypothetical protein